MRTLSLAAAFLCLFGSLTQAIAEGAPRRVVSMNLCTDQLALALAAPGQVVSVSFLSHDAHASVMAAEARRLPANHGRAEEIFVLHPDLVLAGTFTSQATVEMLARLGFRVERFPPDYSLAGIRTNIQRMGQLLGRESQARDMLATFDRGLKELRVDVTPDAPLAAAYHAGGLTSGIGTLVDEIITAAGWRNLPRELGIHDMGLLPLELIVMNRPDMLIANSDKEPSPSLAFQNLAHPALLDALRSGTGVTSIPARYSVCGTLATLDAVRSLVNERRKAIERRGAKP